MSARRRHIIEQAAHLIGRFPDHVHGRNVDAEGIARALGIVVRRASFEGSLSGFLVFGPDGVPYIGVNSDHNLRRQRFTIAHELGHFMLHEKSVPHMDAGQGGFRARLRNDLSSEGVDQKEVEANLFAAELLMPAAWLERDLKGQPPIDMFETDSLILDLARSYGVSTRALTIRLTKLGYIDEA